MRGRIPLGRRRVRAAAARVLKRGDVIPLRAEVRK
jgi:hypothetical protein